MHHYREILEANDEISGTKIYCQQDRKMIPTEWCDEKQRARQCDPHCPLRDATC